MKLLGEKINIVRGETFTLNCTVEYDDGAPYVLRADIENPYIALTVASTTFRMAERYRKTWWLDLSSYPAFVSDVVIPKPSSNPTSANEAVYYTTNSDGTITYEYWNGTAYVEYDFSFSKVFLNFDTREWIESIYKYEVAIVGGTRTIDLLTGLWQSIYGNVNVPVYAQQLYDEIAKTHPEQLEGICPTQPLCNYQLYNSWVSSADIKVFTGR